MADEKRKLNEVDVNDVSGGYLFNAHGCGHDNEPWEAIGKRGEILKRFGSREDAVEWLEKNNFSDKQITWNKLAYLRQTSGILEEERQAREKAAEERKRDQEAIITNYNDLMKQVDEYKNKWK